MIYNQQKIVKLIWYTTYMIIMYMFFIKDSIASIVKNRDNMKNNAIYLKKLLS